MDELLGFIVLTGPLFLIVILIPLFIIVAIKLSKRYQGTKKRVISGFTIFALLLFLLFADSIIGKKYHKYLCKNESGKKIYDTIVLPEQYWNDDGSPKFINSRGVLDSKTLNERFGWQFKYEPYIDNLIKIEKQRVIFTDEATKKHYGEEVSFVRYFGWLNNFSPAPNVSEGCRRVWINKIGKDEYFKKRALENREFLLKIFIRK